ncbi:MAG: hypothetical protein Q8904_08705 [Bacteroidota bacterium]|nr:hypothetical protein [Bacteroidota bacterium]
MKKIIVYLIVVFICMHITKIKAQKDISNILKAGASDLSKVAEGYLTPAGNCFSAGLGLNWYNTAQVHELFGFDFTVGAGLVQVPHADQMFSLLGLTNLKATVEGTTEAPTLVGVGNGVKLNLMQTQVLANGSVNPLYPGKIISFTTPAGISTYVPAASIQFTLGLPIINDLSLRYVPKISLSGAELSMWGVGIKHNFKQWIPVVKDLPFDASVLLAYNKFNLKYAFPVSAQINPSELVGTTFAYEPSTVDYSNQSMNMSAEASTANILVSKEWAFFTPYFGFGVTKTSFNFTMAGNYPVLRELKTQVANVDGVNQTVPVLSADGKPIMQIDNLTDPVKISAGELLPNATIGLRLKLFWVLTINGQYTFQKYPTSSVGIGIAIR